LFWPVRRQCCSPTNRSPALDVPVQIQILLLLRQLQQELSMALVFVTHDVGAAAEIPIASQ
jgi:ABC-type microcin C transport system duplicated ATPase subunit YejF